MAQRSQVTNVFQLLSVTTYQRWVEYSKTVLSSTSRNIYSSKSKSNRLNSYLSKSKKKYWIKKTTQVVSY